MRVQERPDPEPGTGEVRVRVRAAGVNFADLLARVGLYPDAPDQGKPWSSRNGRILVSCVKIGPCDPAHMFG